MVTRWVNQRGVHRHEGRAQKRGGEMRDAVFSGFGLGATVYLCHCFSPFFFLLLLFLDK